MQGDLGEELLSLGLSIHGSTNWYPDSTKKRKRRDEKSPPHNTQPPVAGDKLIFLTLLQTRDQMLRASSKPQALEDGKGLQLIHLLLVSATATAANDLSSAADSLRELYQTVSLNGDPIQRVAAYFADGLAARLLTSGSPLFSTVMGGPTPGEEFSAFTHLYRASPYYQFAHFTANQAIIEAFEADEGHNGRSLHVIDLDASYGFQWPSLIQSLSDKASSADPISLRITGFGRSAEELRETQVRLASFAKGCRNLAFEFDGQLRGSTASDLGIEKNATVAVNLVFYLSTLRSSTEINATLKEIYSLSPSLVVLVEKEGSRAPRSFLPRFMESLHYFAAMFDSLDDCLPAESTERMSIERNHLGREIKSGMVAEEEEEEKQLSEEERVETWKERMESSGFGGVKLSSRAVSQAKLLLKIRSHCSAVEHGSGSGFHISESGEGREISLGWQGRHLITASAWHCNR